MVDGTNDPASMTWYSRLKPEPRTLTGSLIIPRMVMVPRMPAPVDEDTGEIIKPATMDDVPDLGDEDAARRLVERQNHAA